MGDDGTWDPSQEHDGGGGAKKDVVLYTSHLHIQVKDKNACKQARKLLSQKLGPNGYKEINFSEHDDASAREQMEQTSGHSNLPQVFVDGQYIGGVEELKQHVDDGSFETVFGNGDYFFGAGKTHKPGPMTSVKSWMYSFIAVFRPGNDHKGKAMWTDPNTAPNRGGRPGRIMQWIVFVLLVLTTMGSYYVYDEPAALQREYYANFKINTDMEYVQSYVMYSIPNILLPFFSGVIVHRLGRRWSIGIFAALVCVGQGFATVGASWIAGRGGFGMLCLGRFIYGVAAECLMIAQLAAALAWFEGRFLGFVCVVFMALPRLGSALCLSFASVFDSIHSMWWGNVFCLTSFGCAVVYIILDNIFERFTVVYNEKQATEDGTSSYVPPTVELFPSSNGELQKFEWKELRGLPRHFWIIMFANCCVAASVFPYVVFGNEYQGEKYGFNARVACWNLSMIYWVSFAVSPVLSRLVDQFGFRSAAVLMGCWLLVPAYPILAWAVMDPFWGTIWIGCGYAVMSAAVWPAASQAVNLRHYGICYAILQATQHATLVVVYLSCAQIRDETLSYGPMLLYIGTFSLLLFTLSLNLLFENFTANRNAAGEGGKGPKKVVSIFKRLDESKGHNSLFGRDEQTETESLISSADNIMGSAKNRRFRDAYMAKIGFSSYVNPPRR